MLTFIFILVNISRSTLIKAKGGLTVKRVSYVELGAFLKKKREEKGLSKANLARLVGVTGPAIRNFELGSQRPSEKNLVAILKALEVRESELEEVSVLSAYRLTQKEVTAAVLDTGWLDQGVKVTDDLPLLQLMDKYGVRDIAAFLGDRGNEELLLTIIDIQKQRSVSVNSKILQRLVMMGRITKLSFPNEIWRSIITKLEEEEQGK